MCLSSCLSPTSTRLHFSSLDCSFHSLPLAPSHPFLHHRPHPLPFLLYFSPYIIQEEAAFRLDAISKGFQAYPYCLVMEAGDDTLKRIIGDQHIAGTVQFLRRNECLCMSLSSLCIFTLSYSEVISV